MCCSSTPTPPLCTAHPVHEKAVRAKARHPSHNAALVCFIMILLARNVSWPSSAMRIRVPVGLDFRFLPGKERAGVILSGHVSLPPHGEGARR